MEQDDQDGSNESGLGMGEAMEIQWIFNSQDALYQLMTRAVSDVIEEIAIRPYREDLVVTRIRIHEAHRGGAHALRECLATRGSGDGPRAPRTFWRAFLPSFLHTMYLTLSIVSKTQKMPAD